jgi:hypothetical protein
MTTPTPAAGVRPPTENSTSASGGSPIFILVPTRILVGGAIVVLLAVVCGVFVLAELAFRRWAPWASDQGMGGLVAMVWMYHVTAIFRRQRGVLGGLLRAFAFAGATGVLIAAALYVVRP